MKYSLGQQTLCLSIKRSSSLKKGKFFNMKEGWTDWSMAEEEGIVVSFPHLIYLLKDALKILVEGMSIFVSLCPDIKM